MKVGIFLRTTGPGEKQAVLKDFAQGIQVEKEDSFFLHNDYTYRNCDVALIFGFYGINRGVTQNFRKTVYEAHKKRRKKSLFIEADPLKFAGNIIADTSRSPVMYFKIPYNSVYYDKSQFFCEHSPPDRWNDMCEKKQVDVLPYRDDGDHILICMNRGIDDKSRSWSTKGVNVNDWLFTTIKRIRSVSNRKIVVRFHPMFRKSKSKDKIIKRVHRVDREIRVTGLDGRSSLIDDCKGAWAAIVYNTSACVIPLIKGIPVFTERSDCMAYPIANKSIEKFINKPKLHDRSQWFYDLGYSLWCKDDLRSGRFWSHFRNHVS